MTKNNNSDGVTQKDYDHATLILKEAEEYDLVWEVETYAERYINEGYGYVESFQLAYQEWVK
jgi:hypothetical protein